MKRETPLRILLLAQLGCAAGAAAFHFAIRPQLIASYAQTTLAMPWSARLALSPAPAIALVILTAAALTSAASSLPRGKRLRHLATTTTLSGLLLIASPLLALYPMLNH